MPLSTEENAISHATPEPDRQPDGGVSSGRSVETTELAKCAGAHHVEVLPVDRRQ